MEAIADSDAENAIAFMGAINTTESDEETDEVWLKEISLNGEQILFKLDSGASVTAIPASMYSRKRDGDLKKLPKKIKGPDNYPLQVLGIVTAHMKTGRKETKQKVYVVANLVMPLMGLPALIKLNLIQQVASVQEGTQRNSHQYKTMFPKVFSGLQGCYKIKLKEGAVPYTLSAPRRVPLPMKEQVKEELDRMEKLGVIRKIEEPTDWCTVVVPKPNKKNRICLDLTRLNDSVCRESTA